jgi:haloalkane dehalogenase
MIANHPKQRASVKGHSMSYVDQGTGAPVLFLHGNPTSSYLWRNIIARLSSSYRCIAPDLIGMGDSDKLTPSGPDRYSFFEHREYLDGFIESLGLTEPLILAVHDWGSALGFDWARRNASAGRVRGIAYMEAIVGGRAWADFPEPARGVFQALRTDAGERMILDENFFVEQLLPVSMFRKLTPAEHDEYRRPFREPGESRRPTLSWPRQLPIDGEPPEIFALVEQYVAFLATSPLPKLFINAEPGRIVTGALREQCRAWPNQRELTVKGLHYVQEDTPDAIADAILDWASTLKRDA